MYGKNQQHVNIQNPLDSKLSLATWSKNTHNAANWPDMSCDLELKTCKHSSVCGSRNRHTETKVSKYTAKFHNLCVFGRVQVHNSSHVSTSYSFLDILFLLC